MIVKPHNFDNGNTLLLLQDVITTTGPAYDKETLKGQTFDEIRIKIKTNILDLGCDFNGHDELNTQNILIQEVIQRLQCALTENNQENIIQLLQILLQIRDKFDQDTQIYGLAKELEKVITKEFDIKQFLINHQSNLQVCFLFLIYSMIEQTINQVDLKTDDFLVTDYMGTDEKKDIDIKKEETNIQKEQIQDNKAQIELQQKDNNEEEIKIQQEEIIQNQEKQELNEQQVNNSENKQLELENKKDQKKEQDVDEKLENKLNENKQEAPKKELQKLFPGPLLDIQDQFVQCIINTLLQFINKDKLCNKNYIELSKKFDNFNDKNLIKNFLKVTKKRFSDDMIKSENFEYVESLMQNYKKDPLNSILKIEAFINFATFFANNDNFLILPDPKADFFGEWMAQMTKCKEAKRFNMYVKKRETITNSIEKMEGIIVDRFGICDFEVIQNIDENSFIPTVRNYQGDVELGTMTASFYEQPNGIIGDNVINEWQSIEFWIYKLKNQRRLQLAEKSLDFYGSAYKQLTWIEERQNGQFGIKIKDQTDYFDDQKLINASHQDATSQNFEINNGKLTNQNFQFDLSYQDSSDIYQYYNTKKVSDQIFEGKIRDSNNKQILDVWLKKPKYDFEKDNDMLKEMFLEGKFWGVLKKVHRWLMDSIVSEWGWYGDSDFTCVKEVELELYDFKSLGNMKDIIGLLKDLPFDCYERKIFHILKNTLIMNIKYQSKYFESQQFLNEFLVNFLQYAEQEMLWNFNERDSMKEDLLNFMFKYLLYDQVQARTLDDNYNQTDDFILKVFHIISNLIFKIDEKFSSSQSDFLKNEDASLLYYQFLLKTIKNQKGNLHFPCGLWKYLYIKYGGYTILNKIQKQKQQLQDQYQQPEEKNILDSKLKQLIDFETLAFDKNGDMYYYVNLFNQYYFFSFVEKIGTQIKPEGQHGYNDFIKFMERNGSKQLDVNFKYMCDNIKKTKENQNYIVNSYIVNNYCRMLLQFIIEKWIKYKNNNQCDQQHLLENITKENKDLIKSHCYTCGQPFKQLQIAAQGCMQCKYFRCLTCHEKTAPPNTDNFFKILPQLINSSQPMLIPRNDMHIKLQSNGGEYLLQDTIKFATKYNTQLESQVQISYQFLEKFLSLSISTKQRLQIIVQSNQQTRELLETVSQFQQIISIQTIFLPCKNYYAKDNLNYDIGYLKNLYKLQSLLCDNLGKLIQIFNREEGFFKSENLQRDKDDSSIFINNVTFIYWQQKLIKRINNQFQSAYKLFFFNEQKKKEMEDQKDLNTEKMAEMKENIKKKQSNWEKLSPVFTEYEDVINKYKQYYWNLLYEGFKNPLKDKIENINRCIFCLNTVCLKPPYQEQKLIFSEQQISDSILSRIREMFQNIREDRDEKLNNIRQIISQNIQLYAQTISAALCMNTIDYSYGSNEFMESFRKDSEKMVITITQEEELRKIKDYFQPSLQKMFIELSSISQKDFMEKLFENAKPLFNIKEEDIKENLIFMFDCIQRIGLKPFLQEQLQKLAQQCIDFKEEGQKLVKNYLFSLTYQLIFEEVKDQDATNRILNQYKDFQLENQINLLDNKKEEGEKMYGLYVFEQIQFVLKLMNSIKEGIKLKKEKIQQQKIQEEKQIEEELIKQQEKQKQELENLQKIEQEQNQSNIQNQQEIQEGAQQIPENEVQNPPINEQELIDQELLFAQQLQNQYDQELQEQQQQEEQKLQEEEENKVDDPQKIGSQNSIDEYLKKDESQPKVEKQEPQENQKKDQSQPKTHLVSTFQGYKDIQLLQKRLIEFLDSEVKVKKSEFAELDEGFRMVNNFNIDVKYLLSQYEDKDNQDNLKEMLKIQMDDLQYYIDGIAKQDKKTKRVPQEEIFVINKIFYIAKCFFEIKSDIDQTALETFLKMISEDIYRTDKKEIVLLLQSFFLRLFLKNADNGLILEALEHHIKFQIYSGLTINSTAKQFLLEIQQLWPVGYLMVQKELQKEKNKLDKNYFKKTPLSEFQIKIISYLINNIIKQIDKEYFCQLDEEKRIDQGDKHCIFDSFTTGKVLALLCSIFPQLIIYVMNFTIEKKEKGLIQLTQNKIFYEYLNKQEPYYFSQDLSNILLEIPHKYYLNNNNQWRSSVFISKEFLQLQYKMNIVKYCESGVASDMDLIELVDSMKKYTDNASKILVQQQQQNDIELNQIQENIQFCESIFQALAKNDYQNYLQIGKIWTKLKTAFIFNFLLQNLQILKREIYKTSQNRVIYGKWKKYVYYYYSKNFKQFLLSESKKKCQQELGLNSQGDQEILNNLQNRILADEEENQGVVLQINNLSRQLPLDLIKNASIRNSSYTYTHQYDPIVYKNFSDIETFQNESIFEGFERKVKKFTSLLVQKASDITDYSYLEMFDYIKSKEEQDNEAKATEAAKAKEEEKVVVVQEKKIVEKTEAELLFEKRERRNVNVDLQPLSSSQQLKLKVQEILERKLIDNFYINIKDKSKLVGVQWQDLDYNLTSKEINEIKSLFELMESQHRLQILRILPPNISDQFIGKQEKSEINKFKDVFLRNVRHDDLDQVLEDEINDNSSGLSEDEDEERNYQIFEGAYHDPELEKVLSNIQFFEKCPQFNEDALGTVILTAFTMKNLTLHKNLSLLSMNPFNCYKLFDAITFILLLDEQDFIYLKQKNHPIATIYNFELSYVENLKNIANHLMQTIDESSGYFMRIQNKWGYYIQLHSIICKTQKIQLTQENFMQPDINFQEENECEQLLLIKQARIILIEQYKQEKFSIIEKHTFFSFIVSLDRRMKTKTNINTHISFFKLGSLKLHQLSEKELQKLQQNLNRHEVGDIETKLRYYYLLSKTNKYENLYPDQNPVASDKIIQWPKYDYLGMFENNDFILKNFIQNINYSKHPYLINLYTEFLVLNPSCLKNHLSSIFEEKSAETFKLLEIIIEQSENFKKQYYLKQEVKLDENKNLLSQLSREEHKNILKEFNEKIEKACQEFSLASKPIWKGMKLFKQILKKIYGRVLELTDYKSDYVKKYKLLKREILPKDIAQQEDLDFQIMKLRHLKKNKKKALKEETKSLVANLINEALPNLNYLFRQYVEYGHMIENFLGLDEKSKEPLANIFKCFTYIITSMTVLATEFSEKKLKKNLEVDESVDLEMLGQPQLARMYTSENSASNTKRPSFLNVIRSYSRQDHNIQEIDLQETFTLVFSTAYHFFNNEASFKKPWIFGNFKLQSLLRAKGDLLSFSEKMKSLQTISIKRAQKLMKNELEKTEIKVEIDRSQPWSSTCTQLLELHRPEQITISDIKISLKGNIGEDQGGVKNEWLSLLSQEIFHPNFGLFILSSNRRSIQPSPFACTIPHNLIYFRYIGRLVAKALIENWNFEVSFAKSFLKHILGKPLYVQDIEELDESLANNLQWTLDNVQTESLTTFSDTLQIFGELVTVELVQNGSQIDVVEQNKKEYVKALSRIKMSENIEKYILSFKKGLHDIIPGEALQILNEKDLGLHLAGMPSLNVDELQESCKFTQDGYKKDDLTVKYFFEIIREWDDTMKANFLFFFTGSFKIPVDGFKNYPLTLTKTRDLKRFPVAHTCSQAIDLPDYQNKEYLLEKLNTALTGFSGIDLK